MNNSNEQIIRKVSLVGNGAHIFVPREWQGEEVILIRKPKKSLQERIIELVSPYLESIEGVFLFGSYARGEEREGSDIDLFVISNKKINIKAPNIEAVCIEKEKFDKAIKVEPLIIHSMLKEAKPIINSALLDELREKYKPKIRDFKEFFESSKRMIQISKDAIDIDLDEGEVTFNSAVAYSLILRLRGVFILKCLLSDKKYYSSEFKRWIIRNVDCIDFDKIYEVYLNVKAKKNSRISIYLSDLSKLSKFLKNEIYLIEHGKKKKEA